MGGLDRQPERGARVASPWRRRSPRSARSSYEPRTSRCAASSSSVPSSSLASLAPGGFFHSPCLGLDRRTTRRNPPKCRSSTRHPCDMHERKSPRATLRPWLARERICPPMRCPRATWTDVALTWRGTSPRTVPCVVVVVVFGALRRLIASHSPLPPPRVRASPFRIVQNLVTTGWPALRAMRTFARWRRSRRGSPARSPEAPRWIARTSRSW